MCFFFLKTFLFFLVILLDFYLQVSSTADATAVPLPHKDCFAIGGRLILVGTRRDDGPPLLGGAAPFLSRFQRATFPAIGKVYPTKLGKAERGKVGRVRRIATTGLRASTGAY